MSPRVAAVVLCLALAGCAGRWAELRDRETRDAESYRDLKLHLDVQATRLTPEVAAARADALCDDRRCTDDERTRRREASRAHSQRQDRFVLVVYTREPAWNDLDRPDSRWRVFLEADGQRSAPDELRKIKRRRFVYERLFPTLDGFREVYEVHFPTAASPGPRSLVITGELGSTTLTWGAR